jgi:hypothetical protein
VRQQYKSYLFLPSVCGLILFTIFEQLKIGGDWFIEDVQNKYDLDEINLSFFHLFRSYIFVEYCFDNDFYDI